MWYWYGIGVVLLALTACFFVAARAMDRISARAPSGILASDADVKTMARYAYIEQLEAGVNWFTHQQLEVLTVPSRDGLRLYGRLLRAENQRGVILAFHGYHSFAEKDFGCIAQHLFEAGYSLLFVDQRAHERSEGDVITWGVMERYDCLEWLETLQAIMPVGTPLYLYGQSMGAATVLMASGLVLPDAVRGIVADCGFTSPAAEMRYALTHKYRLPVFPFLPLMGLAARIRKGFSIHGASTLRALTNNRIPLLLYHGKLDAIVPYSMSVQNDAAAAGPHTFCSMDGAAHCTCFFYDTEQYLNTMLGFLSGCN